MKIIITLETVDTQTSDPERHEWYDAGKIAERKRLIALGREGTIKDLFPSSPEDIDATSDQKDTARTCDLAIGDIVRVSGFIKDYPHHGPWENQQGPIKEPPDTSPCFAVDCGRLGVGWFERKYLLLVKKADDILSTPQAPKCEFCKQPKTYVGDVGEWLCRKCYGRTLPNGTRVRVTGWVSKNWNGVVGIVIGYEANSGDINEGMYYMEWPLFAPKRTGGFQKRYLEVIDPALENIAPEPFTQEEVAFIIKEVNKILVPPPPKATHCIGAKYNEDSDFQNDICVLPVGHTGYHRTAKGVAFSS